MQLPLARDTCPERPWRALKTPRFLHLREHMRALSTIRSRALMGSREWRSAVVCMAHGGRGSCGRKPPQSALSSFLEALRAAIGNAILNSL